MNRWCLVLVLGFIVSLSSCKKDELVVSDDPVDCSYVETELRSLIDSAGGSSHFILPSSTDFGSIPSDPNNPITTAKVQLGFNLFYETAMGVNSELPQGRQTYSCASCHHPAAGFQAGIRQGIGEGGLGFGVAGEARYRDVTYPHDTLVDVQPIKSPSVMNTCYQELMLWNGQFGATGANTLTTGSWTLGTPLETNFLGFEGVETQAIAGLKVHNLEMDSTWVADNGYQAMFDAAFPTIPTYRRYDVTQAGLAIAAFERTILANKAPFQDWLKGDADAMTLNEKRGARLFFGKANCVECHNNAALSSMSFHALAMDDMLGGGVIDEDPSNAAHFGRGQFNGVPSDYQAFKTPQLYNLRDSKFYGHGGNFLSIREVIDYKNEGIPQNSNVLPHDVSPLFVPKGLTSEEVALIVTFLETGLYDPDLFRYAPTALPSGFCFPNNDTISNVDLGCF